jgi:hypothetical protein
MALFRTISAFQCDVRTENLGVDMPAHQEPGAVEIHAIIALHRTYSSMSVLKLSHHLFFRLPFSLLLFGCPSQTFFL